MLSSPELLKSLEMSSLSSLSSPYSLSPDTMDGELALAAVAIGGSEACAITRDSIVDHWRVDGAERERDLDRGRIPPSAEKQGKPKQPTPKTDQPTRGGVDWSVSGCGLLRFPLFPSGVP